MKGLRAMANDIIQVIEKSATDFRPSHHIGNGEAAQIYAPSTSACTAWFSRAVVVNNTEIPAMQVYTISAGTSDLFTPVDSNVEIEYYVGPPSTQEAQKIGAASNGHTIIVGSAGHPARH
jgi:hypothetical protein